MPRSGLPEFVSRIRESELVPDAELDALVERLAEDDPAFEEGQLLLALVASDLITPWQMDMLEQGKSHGFFLGDYQLVDEIAEGVTSTVFLAKTKNDQSVAIKFFRWEDNQEESWLKRFYRECELLVSLDHPHIVKAVDFSIRNKKQCYLVLEYIDGPNLRTATEREHPVDWRVAAEYICQAARGLEYAHQNGIVHRDLKPANLMRAPGGTIKVLDLNIARLLGEDDAHSVTLLHKESVLGSADFLSPEQALDSHEVDHRADIYSLGCTFFFLLANRPPFVCPTVANTLIAHLRSDRPQITEIRSDVPQGVESILHKMMATSVDERYQSMPEVIAALEAELQTSPVDS